MISSFDLPSKPATPSFAETLETRKDKPTSNVIFGLPGATERVGCDDARAHLARYFRMQPGHYGPNWLIISELAPETG